MVATGAAVVYGIVVTGRAAVATGTAAVARGTACGCTKWSRLIDLDRSGDGLLLTEEWDRTSSGTTQKQNTARKNCHQETTPTRASHRHQWWSPSSSCSDWGSGSGSRKQPRRTSGTRGRTDTVNRMVIVIPSSVTALRPWRKKALK